MIGLVFRFSNHCVDCLSGPISAVEPVTSANMSACCRSMMVLLAATRYAPVLLLMTKLREESRKRRRPQIQTIIVRITAKTQSENGPR